MSRKERRRNYRTSAWRSLRAQRRHGVRFKELDELSASTWLDPVASDFYYHDQIRRGIALDRGDQAMSNITLKVNGKSHKLDIDLSTPLLYILRNDLGLQGPRFGCGLGQCGACTVIIKGEAVRSCVRPVSGVQGAEITTLEGLAQDGVLHPIQQAWIDEQVPQCGFCQNGQILTAKVMLDKNPHPTDAQIRETMNGTLCRCMSYYRVQTAVKRAAKTLADASSASGNEVVA